MANLLTIPIEGYEGLYTINTDGEIYSIRNKKYLIKRLNKKTGYYQLYLSNNGSKAYDIHRLVAKSFIENTNNKPTVNHKNGIKTDNRVENLERYTHKEQTSHAINKLNIKIGKYNKFGINNGKSRKTGQYSLLGELIHIRDYAKQATSQVAISPSLITACCRGERKTGGGYVRKYL